MTVKYRLFPAIALLLAVTTAGFSATALAASKTCGIKPMPRVGCTVGKCVDGEWQQNCDN